MTPEHDQFANELYAAGLAMRKAQKDYFRNRTQENLYAAKDAENEFDRAMRNFSNAGNITKPTLL